MLTRVLLELLLEAHAFFASLKGARNPLRLFSISTLLRGLTFEVIRMEPSYRPQVTFDADLRSPPASRLFLLVEAPDNCAFRNLLRNLATSSGFSFTHFITPACAFLQGREDWESRHPHSDLRVSERLRSSSFDSCFRSFLFSAFFSKRPPGFSVSGGCFQPTVSSFPVFSSPLQWPRCQGRLFRA